MSGFELFLIIVGAIILSPIVAFLAVFIVACVVALILGIVALIAWAVEGD